LAVRVVPPREAQKGAFQGGPGVVALQIRMMSLEGRLQWRRHQLFKLRAKPSAAQKADLFQWIKNLPRRAQEQVPASKFRDSLNFCAPHKN